MALDKEKSEEAMTFGELLTVIADQKRRLNVLEVAFSYLAFGLDDKANQLLIHSLKLEAQNQNRDAETQQHFAQLAGELESIFSPPPLPLRQSKPSFYGLSFRETASCPLSFAELLRKHVII